MWLSLLDHIPEGYFGHKFSGHLIVTHCQMGANSLLRIRNPLVYGMVWSLVRLTRSTSLTARLSGLSVSTRTVCDILLIFLEKLKVGRTLLKNWFQIEL